MHKIIIDGENLTIDDVVKVARYGYRVEIAEEAKRKVKSAREVVDRFVNEGKVVYGITTGFGKFSDVVISKEEAKKLQRNLIVSHACGVGEELPQEVVRAIMLLRANALSKGYSGVRLETLETLVEMLNKGVHPVIYEKGSLGASGDLAPLSHMVLVMIGEGEAYYNGERLSGKEALNRAGIKEKELVEKEGLALINGTQVMTAVGTLALYDAVMLSKAADIVASLTVEALRGITDAYYYKVHNVRPQVGQQKCAQNLNRILEGSTLTTKQGELRVQDAYTLRCIPQVHGASKDAIEYVKRVVEIEINSATDNPLIFSDENRVISGGNFHGQPMALAMDFLGIAVSELANISERRIERLVNYQLNDLPAFLTKKGGLNSGFMIAQYTAASLVSENKVLAHPASVDSIPSSANQEDHVSMGTIAARKARSIIYNAMRVLGIEYLSACQAIDLRGMKGLAKATLAGYELLRQHIPTLDEDRIMYKDINRATALLEELVIKVEEKIGELM
ncbi:histidine ammonia-lyase [Caloramator proteoclasticus]|uniref:Histidine ammonia-lyase n=1 Tax=Caloramator proteoclasticus DSM 10124 TaxID=1121262 RepID=A0A1M4YD12_9CLOT|nr:histidine ammonia-lyase [Caloramator proteoclasticus]SHF03627.1 histidine ammonia-lyase [Caloramator proteoclasticus DSM 10124]